MPYGMGVTIAYRREKKTHLLGGGKDSIGERDSRRGEGFTQKSSSGGTELSVRVIVPNSASGGGGKEGRGKEEKLKQTVERKNYEGCGEANTISEEGRILYS